MPVLSRIVESLRDGSFAVKVLNRLSHIKYVPVADNADTYIANHYRRDGWKSLSPPARKAWLEFSPVFNIYKVGTVVYAGANVGATALALDDAFPGREFYLLEPVPQTFQDLVRNTMTRKNMHCINVAAGVDEGAQDMFVDSYSPASSLLPYESIALEEYPFLGKQVMARVCVKPLDDILRDCGVGSTDMLVMDVQGYEDKVLQGGKQTLKSCKVVVSELSLQALYRGSSTFDSVYQFLGSQGFRLRYLLNPMKGKSNQILQIDGVFVRES